MHLKFQTPTTDYPAVPRFPRNFSSGGPRVPGLPIRDCARGCNNCVHTCPQMNAIDVTKKDTIWAFVFGSRIGHIWALSQLSLCTHNSDCLLSVVQLFLEFRAIFFPEWPLIFLIITIHQVIWPSPGTLALSGYFSRTRRGYRDSARLFGESWTKKMRGHNCTEIEK